MTARRLGLTLIELLVTVAVGGVFLALAAPSFVNTFAQRRVEGVGTEMGTDMQLARSEAVSRNAQVTLTVPSSGDSYTIASGMTTIKSVSVPSGVSITAGSITYDPLRGTSTATTSTSFTVSSSAGSLQLTVNPMGRVSLCSPSGSLKGYTSC